MYGAEIKRLFPLQFNGTREEFDKDFDSYRDGYGLIQNNQGGNSGNGIRYTSQYYILRFCYGFIEYGSKEFSELIRSCMVLPGLLKRSPAPDTDQQGLDDYVCAATASCLFDQTIAKEFVTYGRRNLYFYNNKNPKVPTLSSFFGRYPGLIAHFKYSAGMEPSLFDQIMWSISILFSALNSKQKQDDWVLSHCMVISYMISEYRNNIMDSICSFWSKSFYKNWPLGMKDLLTKYFAHEHPLAKWCINV